MDEMIRRDLNLKIIKVRVFRWATAIACLVYAIVGYSAGERDTYLYGSLLIYTMAVILICIGVIRHYEEKISKLKR